MRRLEALPAMNRMQPYTATRLALALGLARPHPDERIFRCGGWLWLGCDHALMAVPEKKKQSGYRIASHLFAPTNI